MSVVRYSTFLIRHWHFPEQGERIEIQHIQTGQTARLDSLGAIVSWIATPPGPTLPGEAEAPSPDHDAAPGEIDAGSLHPRRCGDPE